MSFSALPRMNTPHKPTLACRSLALVAMLSALGGCAIVPGTHTYDMREQSSVALPTQQNNELVPAHVKVKAINAELIIEQSRSTARAGKESGITPSGKVERGSKMGNAAEQAMLDYKLGPGDILNITVWDHPELTIPAGSFRSAEQTGTLVTEDGTIFYPYVGIIQVVGKTAREVRAILAQKLAKVIEKVQIDVRVISYRSKRVYLVGEVNKPGQQPVTDIPMTILEAVSLAGGFTKDADHSQVLLTRDDTTWRVDLQSLYEDGAVAQNIQLQPGDIVNVPDRSLNKVFVLGEVQKPGSFFMNKKRITLAEALADAGYVNEFSSNPKYIFVMRGQTDSPELFHLDAKSPDALLLADRFPLRPRDIVFVDAAEVARWNRVISNILPTATMLNTISGIDYPLFGGRQ